MRSDIHHPFVVNIHLAVVAQALHVLAAGEEEFRVGDHIFGLHGCAPAPSLCPFRKGMGGCGATFALPLREGQ